MFKFFLSKNYKIKRKIVKKSYNPYLRDDDISQLNDVEKIIFIINEFNMEIMNGGICQFLSNSSGKYAPYVSECLEKIGALENKKVFDDFVKENKIDLYDLSEFKTSDMHDYSIRVCKLYDYEKFDDYYRDTDYQLDLYIEKNYK